MGSRAPAPCAALPSAASSSADGAPLLTRRAPIIGPATSIDLDRLEATGAIATSRPILRSGLWPGLTGAGPYREQLDLAGLDASRLPGGPLLVDHRTAEASARVGVILRAWREGDEILARFRFSDSPLGHQLLRDAERGIGRSLSVGYRVDQWERAADERGQPPLFVARRWTALEASVVSLAADTATFLRSANMANDPSASQAPQYDDPDPLTWAGVPQLCRWAGLPEDATVDLITRTMDSGGTPDDVRIAARDHMVREASRIRIRSIPPGPFGAVSGGYDSSDPSTLRSRMAGALAHRLNPSSPLPPESADFRALSLPDMRRELLEARGIRTRGWSDGELWSRAGVGAHTTSDFPLLLGDALNRELDRQLRDAASPLRSHSRERTASDFRSLITARVGATSGLAPVNEAGEFTYGSFEEESAGFALRTYGKIFALSRQALINDDLGAFADIAAEAALAAAEVEASAFVALLTSTALLPDGLPLFHANHANLGTPGAPSIATLGEARQLLRSQRATGGQYVVGSKPAALLVPPPLETAAEQLVATIAPSTTSEVNPFAGALAVEVEPRLTDPAAWYLFAQQPLFIHAYLEGQPGPQVQTREGFNIDGLEVKIRLDFGAGIRDWRLAVRNPG